MALSHSGFAVFRLGSILGVERDPMEGGCRRSTTRAYLKAGAPAHSQPQLRFGQEATPQGINHFPTTCPCFCVSERGRLFT
jgi:hypothetical protein